MESTLNNYFMAERVLMNFAIFSATFFKLSWE